MSKDPAFLFYYQDFIVGTELLSNEEVGAYIRILAHLADKGKLSKEDMQSICRGCAFSKRLQDKFLIDNKGYFFNERLSLEVEKRKNYAESRRKNAKAYAKHMEDENENKDKDINKDKKENKSISVLTEVSQIIDDFNMIYTSNYKRNNKTTQSLIRVRLKEGFTIDDFKAVHRKMLKNWGADAKMYKYLRPQTLYSNKFESYLNFKEFTTKLSENGIKAYLVGQTWLSSQKEKDVK